LPSGFHRNFLEFVGFIAISGQCGSKDRPVEE
jgi:hypothetical protein